MAQFVVALIQFSNLLDNKIMTICTFHFSFRPENHEPGAHSHLRDGQNSAELEMHVWNEKNLFPWDGCPAKKKKKRKCQGEHRPIGHD